MSEGPTRKRVLVVEDEPDIALIFRLVLEGGYAVTLAGSLGEARAVIETHGLPDLVVLDLMLPDGNGLDLCRELKAARPDLPVLIVSAYVREGRVRREELRDCAADAVVGKPFEPEQLETVVTRLVRAA